MNETNYRISPYNTSHSVLLTIVLYTLNIFKLFFAESNNLLEDDNPTSEIVPMKYQKELQDFLLTIKESDCIHIICDD